MKVNLEVDCTPLEARQFFGLPDVQPMQATMMAEMEKNMLREAQRYSPEALMKFWFSSVPQSGDWIQAMMGSMLGGSTTAPAPPQDDKA